MRKSFIYILTNKNKSTLYIGVTNDLNKRLSEHRNSKGSLFSIKYNLEFLIYFEEFSDIERAILREKQLKKWSRSKKNNLIESVNPNWAFIDYP